MAKKVSEANMVMMAVEFGIQLLQDGATEQALSNFSTAASLNQALVADLLSDDQRVADEATRRRLPPGTDMATYTTAPLIQLYRLLRLRGDVGEAFQVGQLALGLFGRLAPYSAAAGDCLDEVGDIAYQAGDHEYARICSEQAALLREFLAHDNP